MSGPIPLPNGNTHAGEITEEEWLHLSLWNGNAPGMVRLAIALAEALDVYDPAAGEFDPTRRLHYDLPGGAGLVDLATVLDAEPLDTLRFLLDTAAVMRRDRPALARHARRIRLEAERFVLRDHADQIAAAIAEIDTELDQLYDEDEQRRLPPHRQQDNEDPK
jgi:hypothetical protein